MRRFFRAGILLWVMVWIGCGGRMPEGLGVHQGSFAPCPDKPNCVSSFAEDEDHQISALEIRGSAEDAWKGLLSFLTQAGNVEIVTSSDDYLHAIYTSSIMRYRDDVEFWLRAEENEIAVRSASRVGFSDMGVNRDRIEAIREALSESS